MHLTPSHLPTSASRSAPPDVAGLSLAQIRGLEAQAFRDMQQRGWEAETVATLPLRWRTSLLQCHASEKDAGLVDANRRLLATATRIRTIFDGCKLEPGATYDDLCHRAEQLAERCDRLVCPYRFKTDQVYRLNFDQGR